MSILDWLFIGLLSSAILFLLFSVLYFFSGLVTGKQVKGLKSRRVKNKKKRKRLLRMCRQLEAKQKKQRTGWLLCLLVALLLGAGSIYSRYYQLTTLTVNDAEMLSKGYYLVGEVEKQLTSVENGTSPEKVTKNLRELTSQLGSLTIREASGGMSVAAQQRVNRHRLQLKELALNVSKLTSETLMQTEKREEYLTDITKIKKSEQALFKEFGINESALKQE